MRIVLGIDAAWTLTQPSGVALAAEHSAGWKLIAAAPSYQRFQALADPALKPEARPTGAVPDVPAMLAAVEAMCGRMPDLVAVDMPLSVAPIVGRRTSDNAVSKAYGGRKAGTHTPSAERPGRISDGLRGSFERAGYPLCTSDIRTPGLIEVYPHPALIELADAAERLPYKAGKVAKYWAHLNARQRRERLFQEWQRIVQLLDSRLAGVADALPGLDPLAPASELKAYEDKLDAVVCAWVAACALDGCARPFGDKDSAIWVPAFGETSIK